VFLSDLFDLRNWQNYLLGHLSVKCILVMSCYTLRVWLSFVIRLFLATNASVIKNVYDRMKYEPLHWILQLTTWQYCHLHFILYMAAYWQSR